MSFWTDLRPASWRGLAFGVLEGEASFGRRNAVHEYPFRDTPWVEDLGRQTRRFQIIGFIVGDDVVTRRAQILAKCEEKAEGDLVHPTLGTRKVALISCTSIERWNEGRYFEFRFTFLEQGARLYPQKTAAASEAVSQQAPKASAAALKSYADRVVAFLKDPRSALSVSDQSAAWGGAGMAGLKSAFSLVSLGSRFIGSYGKRVFSGKGLWNSQTASFLLGTTIGGILGNAAEGRRLASAAISALSSVASALDKSSVPTHFAAVAATAKAIRLAAPTPGAAMAILGDMVAAPQPAGYVGDARQAQQVSADAMRRAAVTEMAIAAESYRAESSADMLAARAFVLDALDAEILIAGDQGEDDVYQALRALRAAVVLAMNANGASLPDLRTITTGAPMPSLALAQRLYRDPGRADELVERANPRHPAFMPVNFKALSA